MDKIEKELTDKETVMENINKYEISDLTINIDRLANLIKKQDNAFLLFIPHLITYSRPFYLLKSCAIID